jgi:hypothetical protein
MERAMQAVLGIYDGHTIQPLQEFRVRPNTRVIITFLDDDSRAKPFPCTRIEDAAGCLAYGGSARTIEEMNASVLQHAQKRWR